MYVYALVLGNTLLMLHFHNIRVIGQSLPEVAGVIDITDDGQLIDLFYGFINKQSSKYVNPGNFARGMFDEIHTFEGGKNSE